MIKKLRKITPHFILVLVGRYKVIRNTESFSQRPLYNIFKLLRWTIFEWIGADISFTTPDGTRFISMPNNYSSFFIYFADYRDPSIYAFLKKYLDKTSVFVDAGANVGTYTVRAGQLLGSMGKVVAIEAHPMIYDYLLKNIKLNNLENVTPLNIALGADRGTAEMSYTVANAGETHIAVGSERKVSVPRLTLDEALQDLNVSKVDYLKIDVEGFEFPLLKGAEKTILKNKKIVVQTELNENHPRRYGYEITDVIDLLFGWGLTPHEIDPAGTPSTIKRADLKIPGDFLWWRE